MNGHATLKTLTGDHSSTKPRQGHDRHRILPKHRKDRLGNTTSVLDDLAAPAPEAHAEFSYLNGEEEKREVTEDIFSAQFQVSDDDNSSHHQRLSRSIQATESDDEKSQKFYMDLMTDTQSLEKPTSPLSASSIKSLSSKRSASSWSSRESRARQKLANFPSIPPLKVAVQSPRDMMATTKRRKRLTTRARYPRN
jgi:hypothetical protein